MTKLITSAYFDIDGSILEADTRPTSSLLATIARFEKRGLNTQRSIEGAEKAMLPYEVNLPTICLLGTQVWDHGYAPIECFPVSSIGKPLLVDGLRRNLGVIANARFYPVNKRMIVIYAQNNDQAKKVERSYSTSLMDVTLTQSFEEFVHLISDTDWSLLSIKTASGENLSLNGDVLAKFKTYQNNGGVIFTSNGVSKATTFLRVCSRLEIDPASVLTVGDDPNIDGEVFRHSIGVFVGDYDHPDARFRVDSPQGLNQLLDKIYSNGLRVF